MADQLSCVGFDPANMDAFYDWAWKNKRVTDMEDGLYVLLGAGEHVGCWLSVDRETQDILDWDVHYASRLRQDCAFVRDVELDAHGQSGIICVALHPGQERETLVNLSVPVLAPWAEREEGSPGLLQTACYAEWVEEAPETTVTSLRAEEDENVADMVCVVQKGERCRNPQSGRSFWHMVVECEGLDMDLLAEEAAFDALPVPGTVLRARVCLTADVEAGVTGEAPDEAAVREL